MHSQAARPQQCGESPSASGTWGLIRTYLLPVICLLQWLCIGSSQAKHRSPPCAAHSISFSQWASPFSAVYEGGQGRQAGTQTNNWNIGAFEPMHPVISWHFLTAGSHVQICQDLSLTFKMWSHSRPLTSARSSHVCRFLQLLFHNLCIWATYKQKFGLVWNIFLNIDFKSK